MLRNMADQPKPNYLDIWHPILDAIDDRVGDAKREYGAQAQALAVIPQPSHTVVIQDTSRGTVTQASISLQGDYIEIKRRESSTAAFVDEETEVIEIEIKNGVVSYIHDDLHRTTDPNMVAEFIVGPMLDLYRAAS